MGIVATMMLNEFIKCCLHRGLSLFKEAFWNWRDGELGPPEDTGLIPRTHTVAYNDL